MKVSVSNHNLTNEIWQEKLGQCLGDPRYVVKPRGMEVRERIGDFYKVPMPAYIDLIDRKVNLPFMFAEAAWIVSGSNKLGEITPFMSYYENFSDDGIFLRGAYGPKIADQLPYIMESLISDNDTRQAVLNIWRERPGKSKDIPCTTQMQFFIRDNKLELVTTMRSNDIVLGFTYDVFTFSMVAKAVQLLLREKGLDVGLGSLQVNVGSLHLYETHYEKAEKWLSSTRQDDAIVQLVNKIEEAQTYEDLIFKLQNLAHDSKFYRERYS